MNEKTGTIEKPEIESKAVYDWFDVCRHIEYKYQCNLESFRVQEDDIPIYNAWTRNFRVWVSYNCYHRGNVYWISRTSSTGRDFWVQRIIDMIFIELPADKDDIIYILF